MSIQPEASLSVGGLVAQGQQVKMPPESTRELSFDSKM